MSHPRHLEPLPSWKENKAERRDKTFPCMEGVEGWAPSGQTAKKEGCQVTTGGPERPLGEGWGLGRRKTTFPLFLPAAPLGTPDFPPPLPLSFSFLTSSPILPLVSMTTYSPGRHCRKTMHDSVFSPPYLDIPGLPRELPTHLSTPSRLRLSPP